MMTTRFTVLATECDSGLRSASAWYEVWLLIAASVKQTSVGIEKTRKMESKHRNFFFVV